MARPTNQIGSTDDLLAALAVRYRAPEFAFMSQVRAGIGMTSHTADAVAMGLSVPRGLELHGFELKTTRSDWMAEKHNPDKSDPICRFCDRWWLVVSSTEIVERGDLPPQWGLLVPCGDRLVVAVEAPKRDADPLDRSFVAAFMRRATTAFVSEAELKERVAAAVRRAEQRATGDAQRELESLRAKIARFETYSGVDVQSPAHNARDIGRAVATVLVSHEAIAQATHALSMAERVAAGAVKAVRDAGNAILAASVGQRPPDPVCDDSAVAISPSIPLDGHQPGG